MARHDPIRTVLIVGGGTAGWMTAAALSRKLNGLPITIRLIESEQIGTVGVGESTVPHIRFFNETLGLNEAEFMRRTLATYKLGIDFRDWGRIGDSYVHPFGAFGSDFEGVPFLQHWLRARAAGTVPPLEDFSLPVQAAKRNRFMPPHDDPRSLQSTYSYAFQFDAGLYAAFLREYSEQRGVERIEGKIVDGGVDAHDGFIASVRLESGERLEADLFIDCSGFRGLLIEQTLKAGFEDWSHWLVCDRAVAVPCDRRGEMAPYTRVSAREAGWIWRIPLQHRVGNGHVYSSRFISDDAAEAALLDQLEGAALAQPNRLRFTAGKRRSQWTGNCVAIGLSAGFLEPLESTSIHLIQLAIGKLIELFPDRSFSTADAERFNRDMAIEYERVRDFLILHYRATERSDSPFWDYCRTMPLPDSLETKMELFRSQGIVADYRHGMFLEPSWIAVYVGQNIVPAHYSPAADRTAPEELTQHLASTRAAVAAAAEAMPTQEQFLRQSGGMAMASA